ncbi:unnamed protein product [Bemisia tabaci]|uniref:CCHC-type domain-containing protein n=1 Tax=Bemisia tabaci TaxID=7038 RepID=A0A9P0C6A4_BEMTA|nr:unnamed protein product [Bemisia tabaci]
MTRFARAKGSKASNEKLPEPSTPWGELRKQMQALSSKQNPLEKSDSEESTSSSDEDEQSSAKPTVDQPEEKVWAELSATKEKETESEYDDFLVDDGTTCGNSSILLLNQSQSSENGDSKPDFNSKISSEKLGNGPFNNRSKNFEPSGFKKTNSNGIISRGDDLSYTMLLNGEVTKVVNFEGFNIKEVDAKRLYELRKKLYQEKKIPHGEIVRTIQLERRKAEKALQREMKNVCYNCRKSGHFVQDCPEYKKSVNEPTVETGICYKCGSTEHTSHECRLKHGSFRFAKCFICNEQGHISRECPDNPRGIYPKGGACKGCGDVTHFAKDCPVLIHKKEKKPFTLGTLNNNDIEALDDNFGSSSSQPRHDKKRRHSGMKSFYRQKRLKKSHF